MEQTLVECPTCKGEGKLTINAQQMKSVGGKLVFEEQPPVTIDCVICHGEGKITEEYARELMEFEQSCCTCEDEVPDAFYVADGQCECGIQKHHYHCRRCGKIQQIG